MARLAKRTSAGRERRDIGRDSKVIPLGAHRHYNKQCRSPRQLSSAGDCPMLTLTLVACTVLPASIGQVEVEADYVLRGGEIYDGTGGNATSGDVAIKGDRVVAVGKF